MSAKTPIRTVFNDSNVATGLAEFQTGEFVPLSHGGIGAALSIGSAGQVLKVNSGATALEFGAVEAIVNIDGATDLTGNTLAATDKLLVSDGGTEGRANLSQIGPALANVPNSALTNSTINFGGVSLALGASDTTPAFDLSDATAYPTSSLVGTITNAQLAGSIANAKLSNSVITIKDDSSTTDAVSLGEVLTFEGGSGITTTVTDNKVSIATDGAVVTETSTDTLTNKTISGSSNTLSNIGNSSLTNSSINFGGVSLALGASDTTPAFDLSDATNYPTSSLTGTITNAQLAGSIENSKLSNSSVNFGGITVALGASDTTPAFDLSDATNYPTSSLTGTITNAQLAGSIANSKLANSTINFGGVSLALGASDTTPAFDLSDATSYPTSSLTGTITNAQLAGSIANSKLSNSAITIGTTSISLGASNTTIGGISNLTAGGINITGNSITSADSTIIEMGEGLSVTGNLTVSGNMTVSGSTTTLETTNSTITDKLIELGNGTSGTPSGDAGIIIERGSSNNAFIGFDESADKFIVGTGTFTGSTTGDLSITSGTLVASAFEGNLTGNADTATTLATARAIAGQNFDGSAAITIASTDLSNTSDIVLLTSTQTLTNKTLTSPKINEDVAVTATATQLNHTVGVTSAIQSQLDSKTTPAFAIAQAVALG